MSPVSTIENRVSERGAGSAGAEERAIRVLHYLFFPGGQSGIGRYADQLIRRLDGYDDLAPELVCCPSCHWIVDADYEYWTGLREIAHPRPTIRRARFLAGQFANPRRLIGRVRETAAEIVHLSNINHLTVPLWLPRLRTSGAKIVATVHDVFRQRGILNRRYEARQLERFYREADHLFVHGQEQAAQLEQMGVPPARVTVVPHGPYDSGEASGSREELRRRYGLPLDEDIALCFGHVRDEKNLDLFLRSVAEAGGPLHCLVAGSIGSRQKKTEAFYRSLVESLGLIGRVTFLNRYIPDAEIADLFTLCDWAALPYSRSFSSQSGVLNVAARYDRPVLVTRSGAMGRSVEAIDIGVVVEPDAASELTAGIKRITQRLRDGDGFAFEAYRRANSWERNAEITRDVYRRVLGLEGTE